jgi:hypothetical protein
LLGGSPPVAQGGLAQGQQLLAPGAAMGPPGGGGQCGIKPPGEMPNTPSLTTEEDRNSHPKPILNNFQGDGSLGARIGACWTVASHLDRLAAVLMVIGLWSIHPHPRPRNWRRQRGVRGKEKRGGKGLTRVGGGGGEIERLRL